MREKLQEILSKMNSEISMADVEVAHINADNLLEELIKTISADLDDTLKIDIASILISYNQVPKWYA